MYQMELAGIVIEINNRHKLIQHMCEEYLVTGRKPQIFVEVTDEEIKKERMEQADCYGEHKYTEDYIETVCAYRQIAEKMVEHRVLLIHASILELDRKGYAFLGSSGIGKTTQTRLWLAYFGDRVRVINGDKPLLRFNGNDDLQMKIIAYGTPWNGKEGYGCRGQVPMDMFFFLTQSKTPAFRRLSQEEALDRLMHQLLLPKEEKLLNAFFDMVEEILNTIPIYELACNRTDASVQMAVQAIQDKNHGTR